MVGMTVRRLLALLTLAVFAGVLPATARQADVHVGDGVVYGDLGRADSIATARAAFARHAARLGVDPDAFHLDAVRRSNIGLHLRGREVRAGVPVADSSAAVHVVNRRVVWVEARPAAQPGSATADPLSRHAAIRRALLDTGAGAAADVAAQRLLVRQGAQLVDVWRVHVFGIAPPVAATVDVAADDGRVLRVWSDARHLDGQATVFDPNPVVTARDSGLRQPAETGRPADADLDSAELTAQLRTLPLRDLDATALLAGRLVGPWVDVQGPAPHLPDGNLGYTRMDPRFEAAMAYAHIDRFQRYLQSLGLTDVNAEPQKVVAVPLQGFDNSFYHPGSDVMAFGAGGVDDGEDAEVILHEYGHAIQDAQVPGWGSHHEGGAMGEGFGDFLAGAYYALGSDGFGNLCVADWDATTYSASDPPCLRRLDSDKRYPEDMTGSVHADGQLWSAFLWRVRSRLGTTTVERTERSLTLVLTAHELLTTNADFGDAVVALRQAALALGHPKWAEIVDAEAARTGFGLEP